MFLFVISTALCGLKRVLVLEAALEAWEAEVLSVLALGLV